MGLETGTYISDLVTTNPISGDSKSVGDDHLRLIKSVLKTTFPNATAPFYFPRVISKNVNYAILPSDRGALFILDTTVNPFTMVLPTLTAGDNGWSCEFWKYAGGTKEYYVTPPSGLIFSGEYLVARARRCVIGRKCSAMWSGSSWFVTRVLSEPAGSMIPYIGTSLPSGFEWPNGQTLSVSTYPEYEAAVGSGVTPDNRGRVAAGKDDMGGSSANRLTGLSGGLNGDTLGATGGVESHTMTQAQLPNVSLTTSIGAGQGSHVHPTSKPTAFTPVRNDLFNVNVLTTGALVDTDAATLPAMSGTTPLGGSGTAHNNVQPTIIMNQLLVVE